VQEERGEVIDPGRLIMNLASVIDLLPPDASLGIKDCNRLKAVLDTLGATGFMLAFKTPSPQQHSGVVNLAFGKPKQVFWVEIHENGRDMQAAVVPGSELTTVNIPWNPLPLVSPSSTPSSERA